MVDFLYSLNGLARYPAEMIRTSGKIALYLFLPLTLCIATPVKVLLQKNPLGDIVLLVALTTGLLIISRMFWKHSLKYYTSAS